MITTDQEYKESRMDGWVVNLDGERVQDVTAHPLLKPLVEIGTRKGTAPSVF